MGVAGGNVRVRGLGFVCVCVKAGWCVHVTCPRGVFRSRGGVREEGLGVCGEACGGGVSRGGCE